LTLPPIIKDMRRFWKWTLPWIGTLILLACVFGTNHTTQAQTPGVSTELDLDLRVRIAAVGASGSKLHTSALRLGAELGQGWSAQVYGTHRYGAFALQKALVEKELGDNAGRVGAGIVRLPFGIYDPRETYASGLIDYPMPRGDYYWHSVDWGAPGVTWSGGLPRLQIEAAGLEGRGTGIWDNQTHVRGAAVRAQTYIGNAILGVSRWDGALQDVPTLSDRLPVHMTGLDLRYTKTQLLVRGEYLFGTLAGDHERGWYLDMYYRLPQHQHWSLVARLERLKPGDDYPESRQITLGVRYVATREWTLAANWRHNNGLQYSPNWNPGATKGGDVYLQAYHHVNL
jgi:hypothetical protein